MGRCPTNKKSHKKGFSHKTALRAKFMKKGDDLIHAELRAMVPKPLPVDEDLPGMGQFYCLHCDRYFGSSSVRDDHFKTKLHKKRAKIMQGEAPHTQADAELASGKGRPDNGPSLRDNSYVLPMAEWSDMTCKDQGTAVYRHRVFPSTSGVGPNMCGNLFQNQEGIPASGFDE